MSKAQLAKQLGIARSTLYYQSKLTVKDEQLRQDILRVLHLHPSYGHRRLAIHLQLYVYNHWRIHLSLRMAPKQYLAQQTKQAQLATAGL